MLTTRKNLPLRRGIMQRGIEDSGLFDDFFKQLDNFPMTYSENLVPSFDMWRKENDLHLRVELPGVKKEDINIYVDENESVFVIEGEKQEIDENQDKKTKQCKYGKFKNSFLIEKDCHNFEDVKTNFENGVLNIVIPYKKEKKQKDRRTIPIE